MKSIAKFLLHGTLFLAIKSASKPMSADEEIIGHVPRGTAEDADRAVRAAREAFRNWRWVPGLEKAAMLHRIASRIRAIRSRCCIESSNKPAGSTAVRPTLAEHRETTLGCRC